jgi:SAM-dependent methyltransferase
VNWPSRACPICQAAEASTLFRQRFEPVDGVSVIDGYDVVTCDRCGFAYADHIPDQRRFDQYYRDVSKYEYDQRGGEESDYDRDRMEVIADIVAPLISSEHARVIDVGCASGRLLYLLSRRGFKNVYGLDPSAGCVETARRLYDVNVVQGHLSDFPALPFRFDVVILVGVLEHICDLAGAMTRIRSIVAPRGVVYVEVPDAWEFSRWPNAPFQDFSIEHINFFSPRSLTNLFGSHAFDDELLLQNHRVQAYKTVMSNVSAAFRHSDAAPRPIVPDRESRPALQKYIDDCSTQERQIAERIDEIVRSQRPIVIWGVGTNATRLLRTTRLAKARIAAFVDSNSKYQGKSIAGRPIIAPSALRVSDEPILVVSRVFQNEIVAQIRQDLGDDKEIVTLYDVT